MLGGYPKIYNVGHPRIEELFKDKVIVEEKIDGSFIAFGMIDGKLQIKSKNKDISFGNHEKMFSKGIKTIENIADKLMPNKIYRGEYLKEAKHNTIKYERTPLNNIIIFDIDDGNQNYVSYEEKRIEAKLLGLEVVPLLYHGLIKDIDILKSALDDYSILGGSKIEGFVVKNYSKFSEDAKCLMGKHVSDAFKETNKKEWKDKKKSKSDVLEMLINYFKTNARWEKAIQHLRDNGDLENSPKDIGNLIKEIPNDIKNECELEIKEMLFKHYWPLLSRGVIKGFPEYYKNKLLESIKIGG